MILWFIIVGVAGGILGGMGMGGGTLLIPLMIAFLNFGQLQAQTINLIAFLPMSIVAIFIHIHNHLVKWKVVVPILIISSVSAIGGAFLISVFDVDVIKKAFGIFLIVLSVFQFGSAVYSKNEPEAKK